MPSPRCNRLIGVLAAVVAVIAASMPPAAATVLAEQQDAGIWNFDGPAGSGIWGSAQYSSPTHGDILFVGGKFTRAREKPLGVAGGGVVQGLSGLAAIDMDTGAPIPAFKPIVTGADAQKNEVHALAVVGGTLYVGGQFGAIDGQSHYNIAAIDIEAAMDGDAGTPAVIPSFDTVVGVPGASNENKFFVYEILPGSDGLYIGGSFSKVDAKGRSKAAKIGFDGSLKSTWKVTQVSGAIRDMEFSVDRATIFVAGAFKTFRGVPRVAIARVSATDGLLDAWQPASGAVITGSGGTMTCWDVEATATRLFAGCGRGPNYAMALRLDNGNSGTRTFSYGTPGNVQAVRLAADGDLFIGGHFGTNLGYPGNPICSSRPDGARRLKAFGILHNVQGTTDSESVECSFLPQFWGPNGFGGVWEIQVSTTDVWVMGEFHEINCPGGLGKCNNQWLLARFSPVS